jgi:hypothetical protein
MYDERETNKQNLWLEVFRHVYINKEKPLKLAHAEADAAVDAFMNKFKDSNKGEEK